MTDTKLKEAVQIEAQKLFDANGEVKPSELLDSARPKDSPAHNAFEWNNTKAGQEFRLIQARNWLRVVVIRTESEAPERLVHVPRVVSSGEESKEGSYKPATALIHNIDEFERALNAAMQRLNAARQSVEELRNVAEKSDKPERAAMVSQVSRALDIMQQAIQSVH